MNPMDYLKPEFLTQQWTAFWGAWLIMLPTILGAGWLGWWLCGTRSAGTIAGLEGEKGVLEQQLKAQTSVLEERLKLATDQTAKSDRALNEVEKQFQLFKEKVAIEGSNASSAKVDAAIAKANHINIETKKKLVDALVSRKYPVINVDSDPKIR